MVRKMKNISAIDKLLVSIINTVVVGIIALFLKFLLDIQYKYILLCVFYLYQLIIIIATKDKRSIGQNMLKIYWAEKYSFLNHFVFATFYSLSFATIIVWIIFPFDLLLVNLILIQYPMVHFTGYTLHGYLSGKMKGMKKN